MIQKLRGYSYSAVVFHSMTDVYKLFIKFIPKTVRICWIGFGFDYYERSKLNLNRSFKERAKFYIKSNALNLCASYQRINFFCPVLESEFNSVVSRLNLNAEYVGWNYGSSNNVIERLKNEYVNGNSILLGNSATETNNHLAIIDELEKNNEQKEIIIPLSYGSREYTKVIKTRLSKSKLNYTLLTNFMSQEEYFNTLKRCSFVIMNHKRQQAAGNIITMLSLGAKVILDKENPLYKYTLNMGFKVFDNKDLGYQLSKKLHEKDKASNKSVSVDNFNSIVTLEKTKNLINKLTSIKV